MTILSYKKRTGRGCFTIFLLGAALLWGCRHQVAIQDAELGRVARYSQGELVSLPLESGEVALAEQHAPILKLRLLRSCSVFQVLARACDKFVAVPLSRVSLLGEDRLRLEVKMSSLVAQYRTLDVSLAEVKEAMLSLRGYTPPSWRPRFGLGFAVAGPSGLAALEGQYLAAPWLALEAGLLPAADLFSGFVGMRLRPVRLGPLRPFVGAWASYMAFFDPGSGNSDTISATGPRLGLDLEIFRGRALFTMEADLVHPLEPDREFVAGGQGEWLFWGGGAISYFF